MEITKEQILAQVIRDLLPYVHHNCSYNRTDSPEDDFCYCKVGHVVKKARNALELVKT